jgi:hypothetical protein
MVYTFYLSIGRCTPQTYFHVAVGLMILTMAGYQVRTLPRWLLLQLSGGAVTFDGRGIDPLQTLHPMTKVGEERSPNPRLSDACLLSASHHKWRDQPGRITTTEPNACLFPKGVLACVRHRVALVALSIEARTKKQVGQRR